MANSLLEEFIKLKSPSPVGVTFLEQLESSCAADLWQSAGGHWSTDSISAFRSKAIEKLGQALKGESFADYQSAWTEVVRDFHKNYWGEIRLKKKEAKVETEEKKIFWELFAYIWALLQTTFVTKTAIFYFGIKSAQEDSSEDKIYVVLAILFSFGSLTWFAYRRSKKKTGPFN